MPNFLAPTPSRKRPPPHPKISGPKSLGLGSFFLPDNGTHKITSSNFGHGEVRVYRGPGVPRGVQRTTWDRSLKNWSSISLVLKSFSGEGTLWDSSLPVSLTLWDTLALFTPFPSPQNSRSSQRVPCYSRSSSRNSKFHSRNGIPRIEQYENHDSRSNSRSDSRNVGNPHERFFISIIGAGDAKLSTTTAREQDRALGPQVYCRYPNLGKHRKSVSTIAFAGSAKIWAPRWW